MTETPALYWDSRNFGRIGCEKHVGPSSFERLTAEDIAVMGDLAVCEGC